ncbi:NAD-dependent epimerase/dehydratase family protein [Luteimonas kalidii]|uniref:NAD-dependent epimerase/dehydratase family protein n=1 Tax=Luteimonas kalidii TaxID=3042025 RepID=A0ABT6JSB2_9GAMM|nr:NAD-dependent epimerase/dehydratase family protein [Luteimonas kalidii]MDH5833041.1 NAD-dependent epimerase/dehydratase family protein [Luteimonas kalidii]
MRPQRGRTAALVLGAGGFIGKHLVDALDADGTPVIAATRTPLVVPHDRIRNVVDSFVGADAFDALLGDCKVVVHAAAHSTPGSSMTKPQLDGDLRTTMALLEALQAHPECRLVFLSSAGTIYGDRAQPAREDDPLRPRSYHGAGKAAAEHFIEAWAAQHDATAVVLRPSNVYGQGQLARNGFAIVPTAMRCARDGLELQVYGDGLQVRDYLHVHDLTRLCQTAVHTPLSAGTHVFNASSGVPTALNTLLDMIGSIVGLPLRRRHVDARRADVRSALVDPTAAAASLGWRASTPLQQGLEATWDWVRTRQ